MEEVEWKDAKTLEEVLKQLIESGNEKELLPILANLPLEKKLKYRKLWKEMKEKKFGKVGA